MNNRKMTSVTETPALPIILMWTNARSVHYVKVATRKEPRQKHMRLPSNRMNSWSKSNIKNRRVYKSSEETIQDRSQNSELKNVLGYDRALSYGLSCMEMQGALTIFAANVKRIIKLMQNA